LSERHPEDRGPTSERNRESHGSNDRISERHREGSSSDDRISERHRPEGRSSDDRISERHHPEGRSSNDRVSERHGEGDNKTHFEGHVPEGWFQKRDVSRRLQETAGSDNGPPAVNNNTSNGSNSQNGIPSIPGTNTNANGPQTNTAGTTSQQQNGPRNVPGFDTNVGGNLNFPGATHQHGPDDAKQIIAKMDAQAQQLVNQANQGGFNSLNVPSSAGASVTATDDDSNNANGDSSAATAANAAANNLFVAYTSGLALLGPSVGGMTGAWGFMIGREATNYLTGKNDPNPEDSGSKASAKDGLSAHSPYATKDHGGGTGNNVEGSGGNSGTLSPNSAYARKNQGDGGSDENSSVDHAGSTLATGSAVARKGYGDGGGSDDRGGAGGSTTLGRTKINPSGGQPHESTASGGAVMGD
jgi:hypothetical protein